MTDVVLLSSSPSRRDALRRALESAVVRVIGEGDPRAMADGGWPGGAVLVLDGSGALASVADLEDRWPAALVLLADDIGQAIDELRRFDAPGWAVVPSDAGPERLQAAVLTASAGMAAVPSEWVDGLPDAARTDQLRGDPSGGSNRRFEDEEDGVVREALTARESEVLESMAHGLSNREIGVRLGISEHTAKFHVASVLGKLRAQNRADAVRRGVRRGLVTV